MNSVQGCRLSAKLAVQQRVLFSVAPTALLQQLPVLEWQIWLSEKHGCPGLRVYCIAPANLELIDLTAWSCVHLNSAMLTWQVVLATAG